MRQIMIVAAAAALLAGCAVRGTGEQFLSNDEIEAKDHNICTSLGAVRGSQPYIDCRLRLRSDRSAEDRMRRYN